MHTIKVIAFIITLFTIFTGWFYGNLYFSIDHLEKIKDQLDEKQKSRLENLSKFKQEYKSWFYRSLGMTFWLSLFQLIKF